MFYRFLGVWCDPFIVQVTLRTDKRSYFLYLVLSTGTNIMLKNPTYTLVSEHSGKKGFIHRIFKTIPYIKAWICHAKVTQIALSNDILSELLRQHFLDETVIQQMVAVPQEQSDNCVTFLGLASPTGHLNLIVHWNRLLVAYEMSSSFFESG